MAATAIVPVKRFGAAKQRLSEALAPPERAELAAAMVADVLELIGASRTVDRTIVVSGEPMMGPLAAAAGAELLDDPDDRGHSEAAAMGVRAAAMTGAESVALLPGDCPLLDPAELDAALDALEPGSAGVIPDRHRSGTNGLLLRPPDAIAPAFGPGSRDRHLRLAAEAGVNGYVIELESLALDLDTESDLAALRLALQGDTRAPRTRAALR